MKLDRNTNSSGLGKYALINLRTNQVQWGRVRDEDEFFVIKLKDKHAKVALKAYAQSATLDDPEWGEEVHELAERAGPNSPFCKRPD